jgi:glycosyltransferase involved in cell wall biosynthesis
VKVSVCIITYNHASYLRDCLDGAVNQKFDGNFEIVISDDCSTDNTLDICYEYQELYPDLIRVLRHDENMGMTRNWYEAIQACKGEFIAICEGDDYWVDTNKINSQYNYMLNNFKCNITFHDVLIKGSLKPISFYFKYPTRSKLNFKHVLLNHQIPTCSMMIRKAALVNNIPSVFLKFPVCDIPLQLLLVQNGYAYHMKNNFAVYRINGGSITNNQNKNLNRYLKLIEMYWSLFLHFRGKSSLLFVYKMVRLFSAYIFKKMKVE